MIPLQLISVRNDRNCAVSVLSSNGLLKPHNNTLVIDYNYRPLLDQVILDIEIYKSQFIYLTKKTVFSNSWGGKFDINHEISDPKDLIMCVDFSFLIVSECYAPRFLIQKR